MSGASCGGGGSVPRCPRDSVGRSGERCQALCMYSHTHTQASWTQRGTIKYKPVPPTRHWWSIIKIILPPSLCFHLVTLSHIQRALCFLYRMFLGNRAQLDWRLWKWGSYILKGDTIRMGAAHWREASTKGDCRFLTCLVYVNEPFSRSDIITARGYCLWWKYLSCMPRPPHGGWRKSKEWQSSGRMNSHLPCLEVKESDVGKFTQDDVLGEKTP